jgi:hypothetical protein
MDAKDILRERIDMLEFDLTMFQGARAALRPGGTKGLKYPPVDDWQAKRAISMLRDNLANQRRVLDDGSFVDIRSQLERSQAEWWKRKGTPKIAKALAVLKPKPWLRKRIRWIRVVLDAIDSADGGRKTKNQVKHALERDLNALYKLWVAWFKDNHPDDPRPKLRI